MEEILYEEGIEQWREPGHWCRVILRAIAVDRQVYLDCGGFETQYGRFAGSLSPRRSTPAVTGSASRRGPRSTTLTRPRFRDRAARVGLPRWRHGLPARLPGRVLRALLRSAPGMGRAAPAQRRGRPGGLGALRPIAASPAHLADTLGGFPPGDPLEGDPGRVVRLGTGEGPGELAYALGRIRCWLWRFNDRRLLRAYRYAWAALDRRTRLRWLAGRPAAELDAGAASPFELAELSDDRLFGFHRQEQSNGTRFRWSRSVAFADVPVDRGAYRVEIDTGGLRGSTRARRPGLLQWHPHPPRRGRGGSPLDPVRAGA